MRVLFIHKNFPAQFRHLALALARDPVNQVLFITEDTTRELSGVAKLVYQPSREISEHTHRYVRQFEKAVIDAQAVFRVLQAIKAQNFVPDLIYAHAGWGLGMFAKDIFPTTRVLLYCEWFTHGQPEEGEPPLEINEMLRYRISNAAMFVDLDACDAGIAPTHWQHSRFPFAYQPRIEVLHDGVDTRYFQPKPGMRLHLPGLDLSFAKEIVTYVARGMDTYRGFPQFIEALGHLLARRPECHVVIVAGDRIAYGPSPPGGGSYKAWCLARTELDLSRVHFVGTLPYILYKQVLAASTVHVYLTRPFVLSWSFLEALSTGCLIVASDTPPVREVMEDGINGLLVPFNDPKAIAHRIEEALARQNDFQAIRQRARESVLENYALERLLPRQIERIRHFATRGSGEKPFVPGRQ